MFKRIFLLLFIGIAFKGCTRDDICPEGTATTPNLVITFNNSTNPENRKEVEVLSVETDDDDPVLVLPRTKTDSIAIPLNVNSDTTKYRFIRTTITQMDTLENVDKVMFIYHRKDLYVNRACGFKAEFYNLNYALKDEGSENWIQNIILKRDTVNDENKAHLIILH